MPNPSKLPCSKRKDEFKSRRTELIIKISIAINELTEVDEYIRRLDNA